jgi:hypothetical protein
MVVRTRCGADVIQLYWHGPSESRISELREHGAAESTEETEDARAHLRSLRFVKVLRASPAFLPTLRIAPRPGFWTEGRGDDEGVGRLSDRMDGVTMRAPIGCARACTITDALEKPAKADCVPL